MGRESGTKSTEEEMISINENLIVILAIVAITAIFIVSLVALVSLMIYFTEKRKIVAGFKTRAETGNLKAESDIMIEAETIENKKENK